MFVVKEYNFDGDESLGSVEHGEFSDIMDALKEMNRQATDAVESYQTDDYSVEAYPSREELQYIVTDGNNRIEFTVEYRNYKGQDKKLPNLSEMVGEYACGDLIKK